MEGYYRYWGKAGEAGVHLLPYHLLDVAAVLRTVLEERAVLRNRVVALCGCAGDAGIALLTLYAALHDVGKFAADFQEKCPEARAALGAPVWKECVVEPHTCTGMWLYRKKLWPVLERGIPAFEDAEDVLLPLAGAALGHHGRPVSSGGTGKLFSFSSGDAVACARDVAALLLPSDIVLPEEESSFCVLSWFFAGLMVFADWVGSNSLWFPPCREQIPLQQYWSERALPQALQAVRETGALAAETGPGRDFASLFPMLPSGATPTPLQIYALEEAVRRDGPQLHIFEDLTGGGKTEAAVACVHALLRRGEYDGFYVALPTTATANAMYERLGESYRRLFAEDSRPSLMLAHGTRHLHEGFLHAVAASGGDIAGDGDSQGRESSVLCAAWLADSRKKALLSPCGAGTIDQAILATLPAKHQCLRLFGLAGHVLVVDEVHSYDVYLTELLCSLLRIHAALGGSTILLSATLTHALRRRLMEAFADGADYAAPEPREEHFPLATSLDADGLREVRLETPRSLEVAVDMTSDEDAVFAALLDVREQGGCACWIANTVDQAIARYVRLRTEYGVPEQDILLFHARFAMRERLAAEKEVLHRFGKHSTPEMRAGKLLISTQVVEQSLDLDFDFLASDLAPMDLIIQRAGRCWRHTRPRPSGVASGRMLVLSPEPLEDAGADWYGSVLGNARCVYRRQAVLWRTARKLASCGALRLPAEARELIEDAYATAGDTPEAVLIADGKAEGEEAARRCLGKFNALRWEEGYSPLALQREWVEDERAMTRVCEDESLTYRLVVWDGERVRLWAEEENPLRACHLSEVRWKRGFKPYLSKACRTACELLREKLPDKGRWVELLVLEKEGESWRACVEEPLWYDVRTGLRLE